jgi:hypothetical protein
MVRIQASTGGARGWAARLVIVALILGAVTFPAAADLAEETAVHPLAAQRGEFSLLPESSSGVDDAVRSWLLDPRGLEVFTLATAGEGEDPVRTGPAWVGLGRDTAFLIGYQAVAIGVIFLLPEDVSHWSGKSHGLDQWVHNVSRPTFDEDSWWLNYIAHPYVGAVYYIRARERGFGPWSSFAYSALASAAYEFGAEAFFEKPSIQDLIVTPVGGALLGAFAFEPIRARIKAKPELAWYDHVGLFLTDPLGGLNRMFESLFGIKSDIHVGIKPPFPSNRDRVVRQGRLGLELNLVW